MNIKSFKAIFDQQFESYINTHIQQAKKSIEYPRINNFLDHINTYIFGGGKRIRPYVLYLTYAGLGGEKKDEIMQLGNVFELLHAMLLVHDDIIDESTKRHNVASMHAHIDQQINHPHIAEGQAIVIGDLMLNWALQQLYKTYSFDNTLLQQARKNIHTMINEVCLGQMIDADLMTGVLVNSDIIDKKNLYKTASYTFVRPMLTGAILANADQEQQKLIMQLGEHLGLAFQVRDDLKDILATEIDKRTFSDIQEGQQTFFTQYIDQEGTNEQKSYLQSCMGKTLKQQEIDTLQELFETSGAIDAGKKLITQHGDQAKDILNQIGFSNTEMVKYFEFLIEKLTTLEI